MSRTQPARTTEKGNIMNKLTETDTVLITGKTYPVRFGLADMGGKWNAEARGYDVPASREAEALKLVAAGNTMAKLTDTVLITGKTYPVRFGLSKLGGKWNAEAKGYDVPASREAEALKLVAGRTPGLWPRS